MRTIDLRALWWIMSDFYLSGLLDDGGLSIIIGLLYTSRGYFTGVERAGSERGREEGHEEGLPHMLG